MSEAWTQWEGHIVNGEYHLRKYLGGSSHSAAFLAESRSGERKLATIKLIPANAVNTSLYPSRWSRAKRLSHPHLIQLLEKGRCRLGGADLHFVVMEYAEENLAEILPERALTPAEARDLLAAALEALSYLHSRGFAHGHLKPANVLASGDQLKLASDGVCGPGDVASACGAPSAYDPPEKANGPASPAADVWSLGMTLAEALTQQLPSWDENAQTDPKLPVSLPAPLCDIVHGCLRRDPSQRLTIPEISARLRPPASSPQAPAASHGNPQFTAPDIEARQGRRKNSWVGPALIAAIAVAVLFGGLGLFRSKPSAGRNAEARPATKTDSRDAHPAQPPSTQAGQSGIRSAAALGHKPSPVPGRREALATIHPNRAESPVTISHPLANRDVVLEVAPDVSQSAQATIRGTIVVEVRVQVDSSGNVADSVLEVPGPSRYFARLAMQAASQWKFAPSRDEGVREFALRFAFRNAETTASAMRVP